MTETVPDILARIVDHKAAALRQPNTSLAVLEKTAQSCLAGRRDFRASLLARRLAVIAELKKASPSKGLLSIDYAPEAIARDYQAGGAAALSVLTDGEFFRGSLQDLEIARAATRLPALRKDFTIDDYHVVEAAAHGADAILLIAAILTERRLRDLRELAERYRMAALVEVHNEEELQVALASGAEIVGVNNRDLRTFEISLETSLRLADRIPDSVVKVSESGIEDRGQIDRLSAAGFNAFLIGECLMRSGNPRETLSLLTAP